MCVLLHSDYESLAEYTMSIHLCLERPQIELPETKSAWFCY